QAEDGIRDLIVTGVQTCALPILMFRSSARFTSKNPPEKMHATLLERTLTLPESGATLVQQEDLRGELLEVSMGPQHPSTHGVFRDRKSTRLNSSHDQISYAVFCL